MKHVLVYMNGQWVSFGMHIASDQWTNVYLTLGRAYDSGHFANLFWIIDDRVNDLVALRSRMESDVRMANMAQGEWEAGKLASATDEDGNLHLPSGVALMRRLTT